MTASYMLSVLCCVLGLSHGWLFGSPQPGADCYAPPIVYGAECKSSHAVFGMPGLQMTYSIAPVNTAGTMVCCEALGCGGLFSGDECTSDNGRLKYYTVGCGNGAFSGTLPWGNNLAQPTIKCKGVPFGTMVKFTH